MLTAAACRKIDCRPGVGQTVSTPLFTGADWRGISRSAETG